jgi:hypothetical protein
MSTDTQTRACGSCTLCCKLVPVKALQKPDNVWCKHAKKGAGCAIYADRPAECRTWSCLWLADGDAIDIKLNDTGGANATVMLRWTLRRPDKAHFVIDEGADIVYVADKPLGVMQVWADPAYPGAWREDPAFRALVHRLAREGTATLVRHGLRTATLIRAGRLAPYGDWHEHEAPYTRPESTIEEKIAFFGTDGLKETAA